MSERVSLTSSSSTKGSPLLALFSRLVPTSCCDPSASTAGLEKTVSTVGKSARSFISTFVLDPSAAFLASAQTSIFSD